MVHLIAQSDGSSSTALLFPILIFGALFLFLGLRQRGRVRKRTHFLGSLELGDEVRSIGGIIGVLEQLDEEEAVLVTRDGVKLRFARSAIAEKTSKTET